MKTIQLDALHQDPANARAHNARNRSAISASLEEFGALGAVVVEKGTGRILAGNARTIAAMGAGIKEGVIVDYDPRTQIPVVEADLHGVDATRFALADNRTSELAEWDAAVLSGLLSEVGDMGDMWTAEEVGAMVEPERSGSGGGSGGAEDMPAMAGTFAVLVTCDDELHQRRLLEQFTDDGLNVRAWSL